MNRNDLLHMTLFAFSGFVCSFYSFPLSFFLFQVDSLLLHQERHRDNLTFTASNSQFRESRQYVLVQATKEMEVYTEQKNTSSEKKKTQNIGAHNYARGLQYDQAHAGPATTKINLYSRL